MEFIKKYTPSHYNHFLKKSEGFIDGYKSIDKWVRTRNDSTITKWIRTINLFETNNDEYFEEMSVLLTLIIKFFMIELDIDEDQIKLKNSDIKKIAKNFKHIIYLEYSFRNGISDIKKLKYSLL